MEGFRWTCASISIFKISGQI